MSYQWAFGDRGLPALESFDGDPCHPLLPNPYSWALVEFAYRSHPSDLLETYIEAVSSEGLSP